MKLANRSYDGSYRVDLTGNVYHWLTVEAFERNEDSRTYWNCRCKCGNLVVVRGDQLGRTKSCGCWADTWRRRSRVDPVLSAQRSVYNNYKSGATQRALQFKLPFDYFCELISKPCHYCGAVGSNTAWNSGRRHCIQYNGVDRVDNTQGYFEGNVVSCCHQCNMGKREQTPEQFIEWAERVHFYNKKAA